MSRSRGSHIVNLMPLLDVLLCTMGTLIVILGVINREARFHPAKKAPGTVAQSKQKELIEAREDLQLRIEQVTTAREKTIADLEQSRVRLSGIEDHSRQLADRLRGLKATLDQFQSTAGSTASEHDQLRLQLMQLNTQRLQLKSELEKTRAESKNRQPVYAVIPFEGMYRTNRRPIYISAAAIRLFCSPKAWCFRRPIFSAPVDRAIRWPRRCVPLRSIGATPRGRPPICRTNPIRCCWFGRMELLRIIWPAMR